MFSHCRFEPALARPQSMKRLDAGSATGASSSMYRGCCCHSMLHQYTPSSLLLPNTPICLTHLSSGYTSCRLCIDIHDPHSVLSRKLFAILYGAHHAYSALCHSVTLFLTCHPSCSALSAPQKPNMHVVRIANTDIDRELLCCILSYFPYAC